MILLPQTITWPAGMEYAKNVAVEGIRPIMLKETRKTSNMVK